MKLETSRYIKRYVETNFKIGEYLKNNDLWRKIFINSTIKSLSDEEIINGHKADKVINGILENYIQENIPNFWLKEVSTYIKEYMQKNYPVYFGVLDNEQLNKFISSVAEDSLMKSYGLVAIKNGEANKLINEAVNSYAQVKLTNVWANFEFFCEYIKRVVLDNEYSNSDKVNNQTLDMIVKNIAITKSRENLVDYNEFMNGSYDKIFVKSFDGYYDRMSRDCLEHIMLVLADNKDSYGKFATEYILDNVLAVILKKYDFEEIMASMHDEEIIDEYRMEMLKLTVGVKDSVEKILNNNLDLDMFKRISYETVVKNLTNKILSGNEVDVYYLLERDVSKEKYDEIVKKVLGSVSISARENEISQYILEYIKNRYFVYFNELEGNDISKLVDILLNNSLLKNKSLTEIKDNKFRNKLDNLIEKTVKEEFFPVWNVVDTKRYIYDKIEAMNFGSLPQDSLMDVAYEMFDILFVNHKYTLDYIREGNADSLISSLLSSKIMAYNSVVNKKTPKKVKRNSKKRKMPKNISMLLVVATLTTMLGTGAYFLTKEIGEGFDDISADLSYNSSSSEMFGENFDLMYTKYTDSYYDNAENIVNVYNEYSKYGEVYGYLGFYETYKHCMSDSLAIMDSMLRKIDLGIANGEYKSDMKIDSVYFLDFIYDRLVEMGCEEIKEEKYLNAINEYKDIASVNFDSDKTTMDIISKEDKKLNDVILEITDMYHQYSSRYYKELCKLTEEKVASMTLGGRT